jgi:hypothetical protein
MYERRSNIELKGFWSLLIWSVENDHSGLREAGKNRYDRQ